MRVRKIHFDYAGADGFPKPLTLAMTAGAGRTKQDYDREARAAFRELLPEWQLRGCVVAEEDVEIADEGLQAVAGLAGFWTAA
jgi:hypothetical protein